MVRPRKIRPAGPNRRIVAEFNGDRAVDVQRLEAEIGITGRSQQSRDQQLVDVALLALILVIQQARQALACNYPSHSEITNFIGASMKVPAIPYSVLANAEEMERTHGGETRPSGAAAHTPNHERHALAPEA